MAAELLGLLCLDWLPSLASPERVAHSRCLNHCSPHHRLDWQSLPHASENLFPVEELAVAPPAAEFDVSAHLVQQSADLAIDERLLFYELVPKNTNIHIKYMFLKRNIIKLQIPENLFLKLLTQQLSEEQKLQKI